MAQNMTPEEIQATFEEYSNAQKTGATVSADLAARMKDASAGVKGYTAQLNASLKSLGSSILGTVNALKDGQQGASVFNDGISSAADAVEAFASKFGFLGKLLGTLVTAGARYVVEVNKQSDALFKTYKDISSSGLADAGGMTTIFNNMQKFGYGIEQLGDMTALLKANSKELAAFGGTAASGTKAFADAAGQIQRSDVGKSLQMLGKTPDEINKGIAGFVKQQQMLGVGSASIQQTLAQKSADYVKNLDLMSKLTGESADGLQAKLEQAQIEDAFAATQYELKKKADAGDANAKIKYAANQELAQRLTGTALKEFQQGVGGDISAMGKTLMTAPEAVATLSKSAYTADEYLTKLGKGAERTMNQTAGLAQLNANDFVLPFHEMGLAASRYATETAEQQKDRAKAEQDLQTKGLDPATKAQVELRLEQMKTRDSLQSLINKGINPVTDAMKHLAGATESVVNVVPGTGTSTGTQMGGSGGPSGGFWSNLFKGGGGAKVSGQSGALLDLIGKGESGGNYNALVGGGEADLTNMTVAQVQELQKKMKASGRPSSAVGKYQMIASTLAEQMKKAGLDANTTKFDQKTQDLLAQQLVDQAGYGKKDNATVMKNLAGTWASLPQDMSGRGRYDGFNTNKSNIDPRALASAIAGPNDKYTPSVPGNPSASLPTAAANGASTATAEDPNAEPAWLSSFNANLEKHTRVLSEVADNTKSTAQAVKMS